MELLEYEINNFIAGLQDIKFYFPYHLWFQFNKYSHEVVSIYYYRLKDDFSYTGYKKITKEKWEYLIAEVADYKYMLKLTKLKGIPPNAKFIALELMK